VAGRGINDKGDIVGWYADSSGVEHGFLLSGKKVTTIDDPGGTTNVEGINNKGEASGLYTDTSGNRHGFTYDIKTKKFTELTVPNSTYVEVWGLNDKGVVAIDGENSSAVFVGYLYCPAAKDCPGGGAAIRAAQPPVLHHTPGMVPSTP
jgi:probable HAF family extracellular repeat protein